MKCQKSHSWEGQTAEQQRILFWIRDNMDCTGLASIAFLDRKHVRLTDRSNNHYLVTSHRDGSITIQDITEAC